MNLLDLVQQFDIHPNRVASTNGGEYHSPCPKCGGKDRFIIWNIKNRYYCRQCEASGDAIQFCRDFMGMDYWAACKTVGVEERVPFAHNMPKRYVFTAQAAIEPPGVWQMNAEEFMQKCHQNLLRNEKALKTISERGFVQESIEKYTLGWNSKDIFLPLKEWGLPQTFNENNQERKLWLPKGILVPTPFNGKVIKLKIRRSDWKEGDTLPKYVEISGSMKCPSIYGNLDPGVLIIVEAEMDALLIQQETSNTCCSMALGGASKKPDLACHHLLRQASTVLFSLDFDDAGKKAYQFWRSTYPHLCPWPISRGKSPGDAHKLGVDLKKWLLAGIEEAKNGKIYPSV